MKIKKNLKEKIKLSNKDYLIVKNYNVDLDIYSLEFEFHHYSQADEEEFKIIIKSELHTKKLGFFEINEVKFWNYLIIDSNGTEDNWGSYPDTVTSRITEILNDTKDDIRENISELLNYFGYNDIVIENKNLTISGGDEIEIL